MLKNYSKRNNNSLKYLTTIVTYSTSTNSSSNTLGSVLRKSALEVISQRHKELSRIINPNISNNSAFLISKNRNNGNGNLTEQSIEETEVTQREDPVEYFKKISASKLSFLDRKYNPHAFPSNSKLMNSLKMKKMLKQPIVKEEFIEPSWELKSCRILPITDCPENSKIAKIALVGPPNAGKSTLLNHLIGCKVSITSGKAQTTREQVRGVMTKDDSQIVFVDTPGLYLTEKKSKNNDDDRKDSQNDLPSIDRKVTRAAWTALVTADHILVVIDAKKALQTAREKENHQNQDINISTVFAKGNDGMALLDSIVKKNIPTSLILNKCDTIEDEQDIFKLRQIYSTKYPQLQRIFIISALKEYNLSSLSNHLWNVPVPGPWQYSAQQKTFMSDCQIISEIVREKIYRRFNKEIPYSIDISVVSWKENRERIKVHVDLLVPDIKYKKILVGKDAEAITYVQKLSEQDVMKFYNGGKQVQIILTVRQK